eukprot:ctg_336.g189
MRGWRTVRKCGGRPDAGRCRTADTTTIGAEYPVAAERPAQRRRRRQARPSVSPTSSRAGTPGAEFGDGFRSRYGARNLSELECFHFTKHGQYRRRTCTRWGILHAAREYKLGAEPPFDHAEAAAAAAAEGGVSDGDVPPTERSRTWSDSLTKKERPVVRVQTGHLGAPQCHRGEFGARAGADIRRAPATVQPGGRAGGGCGARHRVAPERAAGDRVHPSGAGAERSGTAPATTAGRHDLQTERPPPGAAALPKATAEHVCSTRRGHPARGAGAARRGRGHVAPVPDRHGPEPRRGTAGRRSRGRRTAAGVVPAPAGRYDSARRPAGIGGGQHRGPGEHPAGHPAQSTAAGGRHPRHPRGGVHRGRLCHRHIHDELEAAVLPPRSRWPAVVYRRDGVQHRLRQRRHRVVAAVGASIALRQVVSHSEGGEISSMAAEDFSGRGRQSTAPRDAPPPPPAPLRWLWPWKLPSRQPSEAPPATGTAKKWSFPIRPGSDHRRQRSEADIRLDEEALRRSGLNFAAAVAQEYREAIVKNELEAFAGPARASLHAAGAAGGAAPRAAGNHRAAITATPIGRGWSVCTRSGCVARHAPSERTSCSRQRRGRRRGWRRSEETAYQIRARAVPRHPPGRPGVQLRAGAGGARQCHPGGAGQSHARHHPGHAALPVRPSVGAGGACRPGRLHPAAERHHRRVRPVRVCGAGEFAHRGVCRYGRDALPHRAARAARPARAEPCGEHPAHRAVAAGRAPPGVAGVAQPRCDGVAGPGAAATPARPRARRDPAGELFPDVSEPRAPGGAARPHRRRHPERGGDQAGHRAEPVAVVYGGAACPDGTLLWVGDGGRRVRDELELPLVQHYRHGGPLGGHRGRQRRAGMLFGIFAYNQSCLGDVSREALAGTYTGVSPSRTHIPSAPSISIRREQTCAVVPAETEASRRSHLHGQPLLDVGHHVRLNLWHDIVRVHGRVQLAGLNSLDGGDGLQPARCPQGVSYQRLGRIHGQVLRVKHRRDRLVLGNVSQRRRGGVRVDVVHLGGVYGGVL